MPESPDRAPEADLRLDAARRLDRLARTGKAATATQSAQDNERLLHELQVHQIELEMQNEQLRYSRAQAEAALKRYSDLYDFSPLAYFTLDPIGKILQTNLAGAKLLGLERMRLTEGRLGAFVAPHDLPGLNDFLSQVFDARPADTRPVPARELRLVGNHEPPRIVSIEATLAPDGLSCNAVVTDITTLKVQQRQLERIAHYDLLTNLPNRVLLADRLQQAMAQCQRRGRSLAVAYLDLDGFKEVNDTLGWLLVRNGKVARGLALLKVAHDLSPSTPDIAYHYNKVKRGFDQLIDIFGADHGGYVKRMKAAVQYPRDRCAGNAPAAKASGDDEAGDKE